MLQQISAVEEWDIVIIGGGATGLGTALDAASRGYKTLLLEQYDFGKGTSSRSTKLVHGGVRYLAQGNIKLVREALRERGYLLKNAPHITTTAAFVVPVYSWFEKMYYGIGLKIYDLLSGKLSLGKTKMLNKAEAKNYLPGINDEKLKGGILYYDGQFDDTRLAIDIAATAAKHGAVLLNYCCVTGLAKKGKTIDAVSFTDTVHNSKYTVKAKAVINATGDFTDTILRLDEPENPELVAPSQGIHLVVEKKFFPGSASMMIPKTTDGRVLFAVPWHNSVVLGTTDTAVSKVSIEPVPLEEEIQFILAHANLYLENRINRSDVKSIFAGLRPLVKKQDSKSTSLLSRDHTIIVSKSNLVTITGGKWTTYRKMAEDALDNAVFAAKLTKVKCITSEIAIAANLPAYKDQSGERFIHQSFSLSESEIKWFVEHEMAITVEDILARRTRLLFLDAAAAKEASPFVTAIMAKLLKRNSEWIEEQVNSFSNLASQYSLV